MESRERNNHHAHKRWTADAAKIDAAISPAFFNVTFTDPGSNSRITKRCYSNTPSYPVYSYVDGVKTYKGVGATLIGK